MAKKEIIIENVYKLITLFKEGKLGGEKMPEHENPHLDISSKENYMYFTLPMAINYQHNSYVLWECANKMYQDQIGKKLFDSSKVIAESDENIRNILVDYKVALQPNKQPEIWKRLCYTIETELNGDIRNLFIHNDYRVQSIKSHLQSNKKKYPYLCGNKICNYWLYVIEQYTDCKFYDRENITVAPDTHVIQASEKLGIITSEERQCANVQDIVATRWYELLQGTGLVPIDVHTPMWLWSRGGFNVSLEGD